MKFTNLEQKFSILRFWILNSADIYSSRLRTLIHMKVMKKGVKGQKKDNFKTHLNRSTLQ